MHATNGATYINGPILGLLSTQAIDIAIQVGQRILRASYRQRAARRYVIARVLLYCELERFDDSEDWTGAIYCDLQYLVAGLRAESLRQSPLGLHEGLAGMLFAAYQADQGGIRYSRLKRELHELLLQRSSQVQYDDALRFWDELDLMTGASGIAVGLALRSTAQPANPPQLQVLRRIAGGPGMQRLYTEGATYFSQHSILYPGIAHGVAGYIASLCLSYPQARKEIAFMVDVLLTVAARYGEGARWPESVSAGAFQPHRTGWCNGSPGVAIAFVHAAHTLERKDLFEIAADALLSEHKERARWRNIDNGLCHGKAGLALINQWVACSTGRMDLISIAQDLFNETIERFDPNTPFGFRAMVNYAEQDDPGLLIGAAGIALALLTAAQRSNFAWSLPLGMGSVDK